MIKDCIPDLVALQNTAIQDNSNETKHFWDVFYLKINFFCIVKLFS